MKPRHRRFFRSLLILAFGSLAALACGGQSVADAGADSGSGGDVGDDGGGGTDPGSGGTNSGGSPATGGNGSGGEGSGGAPPACCLAAPACDEGDLQLELDEPCPIGGTCYTSSICCSTVWCMKEQALCDAIPTCAEGETQVPTCPEGAVCIKRALCGTVIVCQSEEGPACDRDQEVHRHYVSESPEQCQLIDYVCPPHATGFSNACGCGCEQPDTCPAAIDCAPGTTVDPLCASEECPYSPRFG